MEEYYVRELHWGDVTGEEFWRVDDSEVCQINVVSSSGLSRYAREPGDDVNTILNTIAPWGGWHKLHYKPGEYFPRMARPDSLKNLVLGRNPDPRDEFRHYRARSTGQLHAFVQELDQICRVIQPEGRNLGTFGHATRNLLILACTEVEAHWKTVLEDNGYKINKRNGRFDTTDYVNILEAMRLDKYVVNLNYFPWLPTFAPFLGWKREDATKTLPWYQAYNRVKHDREGHFAEATLERALVAVTACFVMLCAQYGWDFALQDKEAERAFFQLVEAPRWAPSEIYVPRFGANYRPMQFPFVG